MSRKQLQEGKTQHLSSGGEIKAKRRPKYCLTLYRGSIIGGRTFRNRIRLIFSFLDLKSLSFSPKDRNRLLAERKWQ